MLYITQIDWIPSRDTLKDFLVPLVGSAAGVWATLAVFKRQLEENRRSHEQELIRTLKEENDNQNNQATAKLSNFVWLLEDVMKFATTQNYDYLIAAKETEENLLMPHRLSIRASTTIDRIFTLKQEDIFYSFIRKALDTEENRIHVAKTYNKLDYIKKSIKSNRLKYKEHIETYHKIVTDYRQHIENIREIFIEVTGESRLSNNFPNDEFAQFISSAHKFYLSSLESLPEASDID